ncbi:polysaccharide biosynthesis tyrosine autokinase [Granulicoccus phenolivorans]|uniref:polysaccharide biosynthesis tyrosine autokinase n=1 Tax=Granulicoccus phenolivorans TaxID=266854 RepID=UPI00041B7BD2|nr:polysaccharide biosynthesis tyrosine autokinase [Granulicoccus phenolivorans]
MQPTLYQSSATGLITSGSAASMGEAFSNQTLGVQRAQTYVPLVTSGIVADRVAEELGIPEGGAAVRDSATAAVVDGSPMLRITATASQPGRARDLADAFVRATAEEAAKLETGGNPDREPVIKLVPLEDATLPTSPVSPNLWVNLGIGALVGLVVGYLIAFLRKSVDNRIRHVSDIEELIGSRALGVIPKASEIGKQRQRGTTDLGVASEAMRQLRTNLRYVDVDNPPQSIVVTSSHAGEGKSTIASNLARVMAAAGQPVILIDCDLRRPMQARIFNLDGDVGLTQVLAGEVAIEDALVATERRLLQVLPAGRIPPNPSELLGSKRMAALIKALSRDNLVILDAPPILPVTDAGLLTAASDGALLVIRVGRTFKEHVKMANKVLEQVNGRLLGTVLNVVPQRQLGSVMYGYGYRTYKNDYYYRNRKHAMTEEVPMLMVEDTAEFEDSVLRSTQPMPMRDDTTSVLGPARAISTEQFTEPEITRTQPAVPAGVGVEVASQPENPPRARAPKASQYSRNGDDSRGGGDKERPRRAL